MPRSLALRNVLDDAMLDLLISDFSGGLNSETDPADLPPNASPDCENVKFRPGRLLGRAGNVVRNSSLPANRDGVFFFYDSNGVRKLPVFANGNLYEMIDGNLTLVEASVYTAGNRVAAAVLNSKLYFSDGTTIFTSGLNQSGIRIYDPPTSTSATQLLITSGTTGTIETPAAKVLIAYNGSLVLGNVKYVGGTTAKHAILWSNVNDPTTIVGTNIFQVGQGQGGEINCISQMGVSSVGVSPFKALFVGKSELGVYLLKGALSVSDLSEVLINCPTGVLDGATVQYIPGDQGSGGFIAFLGTDRKAWGTDGITSFELSAPIRRELRQAISDRFSVSSTAKFTSVRNDNDFMYVIDTGRNDSGVAIHYCYDWQLRCWTRYSGWPSGYWAQAKDASSEYALYCVDSTNTYLVQANAGITDNGSAISPYWKTGYLTAGDQDIYKIWKWIYVGFRTNTGDIQIDATANQGEGDTASANITITPSTSDSAVWDVATWDSALWVGGGTADFTSYKRRARLKVSTSNLDGSPESLRGFDLQVKISQTVTGSFEVYGCRLLYLPRGRKRVAS